MATKRVLGGVALRRAKSAVGAEVVEQCHVLLGELPAALHAPSDLSAWWRCCCKVHMIAKRDLDVPTVCQASPRGVATKAIYEADLRFNRAQGGNRRGACRFINC